MNIKISLKKADFNDAEFLWYLRNQKDVYSYFRNTKFVSWKEHIHWLAPIILGIDKNRELFVIYNFKTPVGQIRFDYKNKKEAEISISILKEFRKKGFAFKSLKSAIKNKKKGEILISEINKNNIGSVKLFEKLNFKLRSKKGKWLKYILK